MYCPQKFVRLIYPGTPPFRNKKLFIAVWRSMEWTFYSCMEKFWLSFSKSLFSFAFLLPFPMRPTDLKSFAACFPALEAADLNEDTEALSASPLGFRLNLRVKRNIFLLDFES